MRIAFARPIVVIAALTFAVGLLSFIGYWRTFGSSLSDDHQRWAEFGSYVTGTIGVAVTAATLVVAIFASLVFPRLFEDQRTRAERKRQTIELSHKLFDKDFYIYISAPAWELAVKWLYWTGEQGHEYRRQVCGGMFLYSYPTFKTPNEANKAQYQNMIRFRHHFLPYDAAPNGYVQQPDLITQLSEHQVLGIWLQFWTHLHILLQAELVDEDLCRTLFREWYGSWLKFMIQFRMTGQLLAGARLPDGTLRPGADPNFTRLHQLAELEKVLFRDDPLYREVESEATTAAKEIAERVIACHNASVDKTSTDA